MNQYVANIPRGSVAAQNLAEWALSHGVVSLSTGEVAHLCGVPASQVPQRMAAPRHAGRVFSPARGLWVPVPTEYRTWGAPDPMLYIGQMMTHLDCGYLVGWLAAAARHGASHQAPQTFQIATARTLRDRTFGRSRLEFKSRSYASIAPCCARTLASTGVRVATPAVTMLMLAADPGFCGGLDNIATAVVELVEENPPCSDEVAASAGLFPDSASRRLGWLLDAFGGGAPASLVGYCESLDSSPSYLSPVAPKEGGLSGKWGIIINQDVEPDL